ncbi:MAG: Xaa-Pro aminopeptidase [Candidatus Latescibacterota bacterium]|jgi:Xaa-Pro aminopeptidase
MIRSERLAQALVERGAEIFISSMRPNQLYFLDHPEPSSVISRPNCHAIIFGLDVPVVFPGVWISNACRDLLPGCEVVENALGDPPPAEQLLAYLQKADFKKIVLDQPGLAVAIGQQVPGCEVLVEDIGTQLRRKKDARDLEGMREAARIADLGMTAAFAAIRPGITCLDVIAEGEYTMLKAGAEDAKMAPAVGAGTYYLDSGENPRRTIKEGDMIFIDMAIHVCGYLGDMTRAGIVGEGSTEQQRLLATVQEAYRTGVRAMRPGADGRDIYGQVVDCFTAANWQQFYVHHLSHGLGLGGDRPRIGSEVADVLAEGDALSCEPGIYVPGVGGARVENMIYIGAEGAEELTQCALDLPMGF